MKERLFRFVLDHPIWVILLTVLFVLGSAYGAKNLVFKSDYRVFFSEENPQLTAFESMQKIYSKSDNVAFILSPKDGDVFTPKTLKAIQALTTESWQVPFSTRVDSITNFQHSWSEEDDMFVEDLVLDADTLTDADMPRLKEIAINEPLLVHKIISPQAHVTVVNVTTRSQSGRRDPTRRFKNTADESSIYRAKSRDLGALIRHGHDEQQFRRILLKR